MNISFTKDDISARIVPFQDTTPGEIFEDANPCYSSVWYKRIYMKTSEKNCAIELNNGRILEFRMEHKVRVLNSDEYKFEVFI